MSTSSHDDKMISEGVDDLALFGSFVEEETYWEYIAGCPQTNTRQYADPYGYIDGGCPTDGYQFCCLSQPWKGAALALHLMPQLEPVWNDPTFIAYADRWVTHGTWTQPDPCAPAQGTNGVDYGPDPSNPGDCIRDTEPGDGVGRFPSAHGEDADGGHYSSGFVDAMWDEYR